MDSSRECSQTVGNDVVDLADPVIAGHHRRLRFVARVCSDEERQRLHSSDAPARLLWSLWAAKEAAYKAVVKQYPETVFSPIRFAVGASMQTVRYDDLDLKLQISGTDAWVHAVVTTAESPVLTAVERRDPMADQSRAVRNLALHTLAAEYNLPRDKLEIIRTSSSARGQRRAPPRLLHSGRPSGIDISLSHDGPFVAFAAIAS